MLKWITQNPPKIDYMKVPSKHYWNGNRYNLSSYLIGDIMPHLLKILQRNAIQRPKVVNLNVQVKFEHKQNPVLQHNYNYQLI